MIRFVHSYIKRREILSDTLLQIIIRSQTDVAVELIYVDFVAAVLRRVDSEYIRVLACVEALSGSLLHLTVPAEHAVDAASVTAATIAFVTSERFLLSVLHGGNIYLKGDLGHRLLILAVAHEVFGLGWRLTSLVVTHS